MDVRTLRQAIRVIAATRGGQGRVPDADPRRERATQALILLRDVGWPAFHRWFRRGFSDVQWARYMDLADRLPGLSRDEFAELLALTRAGLRLDREAPETVEGTVEREAPRELDREVDPARDEAAGSDVSP